MNQELFLGNVSNFAELCGVPKSTLRCWLKGENAPSLNNLLLICFKLNIDILDLLLVKRKVDIDIDHINNQVSINNKKRAARKSLNFNLIEKKLNEFLIYEIPISMTAVAKEIDRDKRVLYSNFPEYCKLISERYRNYLTEKSIKRIQLLKNEINIAFDSLIDEGVYPSCGKIEKKINKKGLLREKVLQDYWKKLLMEKGFVN
ncbi:helix-turn-helix domain-containing protein [Lysinibacillus sphaericus]|uniref:helix-turn-helix domain-containing protein n=1 Tax=Lysinibacillus sphaericus TaxID=1421 RepID=UPI001CC0F26E|nr:helix-turn-helix transcriptional regulator [Lysinibacillus sphaericus]